MLLYLHNLESFLLRNFIQINLELCDKRKRFAISISKTQSAKIECFMVGGVLWETCKEFCDLILRFSDVNCRAVFVPLFEWMRINITVHNIWDTIKVKESISACKCSCLIHNFTWNVVRILLKQAFVLQFEMILIMVHQYKKWRISHFYGP